MTAVLNWGVENYPNLEKVVIGHSMGGQLIGAMKNADKVDRTINNSLWNWVLERHAKR